MKFLLFTAMTPLAGGLIKLNARDRSRTAGNQNMSKEEKSPLAVAENIWVIKYPLTLLGLEFGRTVTLVRLASGEMVIHSTAPFTASDIAAIRRVGEPAWLLDATLFHDSFAQEGQRAFSELPYLAPQGFSKVSAVNTSPLVNRQTACVCRCRSHPPPAAWRLDSRSRSPRSRPLFPGECPKLQPYCGLDHAIGLRESGGSSHLL